MNRMDDLINELMMAKAPTVDQKERIRASILERDFSVNYSESYSEVYQKIALIFDNAFAVLNKICI